MGKQLIRTLPSSILFIACLMALRARSQEITLQSSSTVVLVPTLVTDTSGKSIHGLTGKDFVVFDNGTPQEVKMDELYEAQPVSLVVAIDRSSTARHLLDLAQRLGSMLDPLVGDGKGEVALVGFDHESNLLLDFTGDTDKIATVMKGLTVRDGGPAIMDAVDYSTALLAKRPNANRKVVLLVSETKDEGSATKVEEVVRQIEASNILVYSVTYSASQLGSLLSEPAGAQPGINLLNIFRALARATHENVPKAVAEMTGGEYLEFGSQRELENRLAEVSNHFFNIYLLSFQPRNLKPGQHILSVRLRESAGVTIRSRTGYWAAQTTTSGPLENKTVPGAARP